MVNASRMFDKEPPREPLDDIPAIVRDFRWRYADRALTDQVIEYCRHSKKFAQAVRRAVEARDANGKHHNHQSKVDITARRKFGASIIRQKPYIKMLAADEAAGKFEEWSTPFDQLHDLLDRIKPYGVGPVTVYDVAVRIGAYVGIEPRQLYVHAGVRLGLKALLDAAEGDDSLLKLKRIPQYLWPEGFRSMHCKADEVEDILCTYREVFLQWSRP